LQTDLIDLKMEINIRETTYNLIKNDRTIILIKWEIIGVITRIIIGHKGEIFGKTIIKITIKSNKPSSQWMLIHRFNYRINLITIGSRIIIGRQIIIEVGIIIIIIKIIIDQVTIALTKIESKLKP